MGLVGHRVSICGFEMTQSTAAEKRLWKRWSVCKTRSSWKLEVALKLKSRHLCISYKRKLVNQFVRMPNDYCAELRDTGVGHGNRYILHLLWWGISTI